MCAACMLLDWTSRRSTMRIDERTKDRNPCICVAGRQTPCHTPPAIQFHPWHPVLRSHTCSWYEPSLLLKKEGSGIYLLCHDVVHICSSKEHVSSWMHPAWSSIVVVGVVGFKLCWPSSLWFGINAVRKRCRSLRPATRAPKFLPSETKKRA